MEIDEIQTANATFEAVSKESYIACDLGAGSGRVMVGVLNDGKLTLDEIYRFVSPPVKIRGTLRWNVIHIFEELKTGLRKVADSGYSAASLSVDSWGVEYVLFHAAEPMLNLPYDSCRPLRRNQRPSMNHSRKVGDAPSLVPPNATPHHSNELIQPFPS